MPSLHSDSTGSPPPSVTSSADSTDTALGRVRSGPLAWRANAGLFVATVGSVFATFFLTSVWNGDASRTAVVGAAQFTSTLLAILLAHEFGHFVAARRHRVDASLPYFIPLPLLSPFGTMGAVIRMRSVIPTRRALLDIGAAGPLAGLALALPLYAWGAAHSRVMPFDGQGAELGDSLLLRLIDGYVAPPVPAGMALFLSPVANAGWAGLFVTMINLLPVGQLDGGHVAYALFGPRQNRLARWVHHSMLVFFFVSVASFAARDVHAGFGLWRLGRHVGNSIFWLVWFEVLAILGSITSRAPARTNSDGLTVRVRVLATLGLVLVASVLHDRSSPVLWASWFAALAVLLVMEARWGALRDGSRLLDHPATGPTPLRFGRIVIAIVTLAFFALLFMPTPFAL
jgi:membrane-associated protease RseP (regulator of RpoE activity)